MPTWSTRFPGRSKTGAQSTNGRRAPYSVGYISNVIQGAILYKGRLELPSCPTHPIQFQKTSKNKLEKNNCSKEIQSWINEGRYSTPIFHPILSYGHQTCLSTVRLKNAENITFTSHFQAFYIFCWWFIQIFRQLLEKILQIVQKQQLLNLDSETQVIFLFPNII